MRPLYVLLVILLVFGGSPAQASFFKQVCEQLFGRVETSAPKVAVRLESGNTYSTIPMRDRYRGENQVDVYGDGGSEMPVRYFKEQTRKTLEVGVDEAGLLRKADGTFLNTCYPVTADCPAAIFVMDSQGKIYVYDGDYLSETMELIFHSSILGGKPVASAGEIFVEQGKIRLINDRSGHYRPSPEIFGQVVDELGRRGVKLEKEQIKAGSFDTN